jgi:hypothetical protein
MKINEFKVGLFNTDLGYCGMYGFCILQVNMEIYKKASDDHINHDRSLFSLGVNKHGGCFCIDLIFLKIEIYNASNVDWKERSDPFRKVESKYDFWDWWINKYIVIY